MKRYHRWFLGFMICLLSVTTLQAQTRRHKEFRQAYTAPEELISLSRTTPFNQALLIFNDLSKKYLKKIIIDPESHNFPIGIDVNRTHWLTAFENILKHHDLWYEEYQDYIKIVATEENQEVMSEEEKEALKNFNTREVKISAIFFEADNARLREAGMSWNIFRG
ncbi:MAG: hypothetical protein D6748_16155, partial [Calditrichaeota bacterium]